MSALEFARTPMGRVFFERDVPAIAGQLKTLNDNLGRIAAALERLAPPAPTTPAPEQKP